MIILLPSACPSRKWLIALACFARILREGKGPFLEDNMDGVHMGSEVGDNRSKGEHTFAHATILFLAAQPS